MQASLQFTPDQKQDLLHLRRLFLAKVGQLARQRQAILERIANSEGNLPGSSGRDTQLEDAAQLRQNGIEECQIHLQFVGAMVDGVTFSCCNSCCICISSNHTQGACYLCQAIARHI